MPDTSRCIFVLFLALSRVVAYYIAKAQNIRCIASIVLKFLIWKYGIWKKILVWKGIWDGRLLEWNGNRMEKIATMEYGKIIFHSIPYHPLQLKSILSLFKNTIINWFCKNTQCLIINEPFPQKIVSLYFFGVGFRAFLKDNNWRNL